MQSLEECRKSEEEGKAGQARALVKTKVRTAAATLPPKEDGLSKQLKYQQYQIDALVEQMKDLVAVVNATHTSPRVDKNGSSYSKGNSGREILHRVEVNIHKQGRGGKTLLNNLVEVWYSLEQYIWFEGRQAFIHYCGLHQV